MSKLELKIATWDHLPDILEMAQEFYNNSPYQGIEEYDESRVAEIAMASFENQKDRIVILLVTPEGKPVGMVAGLATTAVFNHNRVATELIWWVYPEYRGKSSLELFKAYEYWAKNVAKCSSVVTALLEDELVDRLSSFYQRQGYTPAERAFIKRII